MADQTGYWKELSDYDIETADALLKSRRYLYLGFMCHQSIEKILKAYFIKVKGITAPFSLSLSYIAKLKNSKYSCQKKCHLTRLFYMGLTQKKLTVKTVILMLPLLLTKLKEIFFQHDLCCGESEEK